jgi:fructose transport system substrate-binding protein
MSLSSLSRKRRRALALTAATVLAATTLAACGDDGGSGGGGGGTGVALITKTDTNPFFVAMQEGAKEAADAAGLELNSGAGKEDGDSDTQIKLIEDAVARGDAGILITPATNAVNPAIKQARDAGLTVIALDTPPDPPDTVDVTYATDNREAGKLIGQWTKAQLGGEKATIALLDLFNDKVAAVDYNRDQGFLEGMGIDVADPNTNGDEAETGQYDGGEYEIVCNEPTNGAQPEGRTAMEACLSQNPDINVVYTINEPSAYGADEALQAAGIDHADVIMVSVDGGCQAMDAIDKETIDATSQQYPLEMAKQGVEAIAEIVDGGDVPAAPSGQDFINTGVKLVTNTAAEGVESIDTTEGKDICWG